MTREQAREHFKNLGLDYLKIQHFGEIIELPLK